MRRLPGVAAWSSGKLMRGAGKVAVGVGVGATAYGLMLGLAGTGSDPTILTPYHSEAAVKAFVAGMTFGGLGAIGSGVGLLKAGKKLIKEHTGARWVEKRWQALLARKGQHTSQRAMHRAEKALTRLATDLDQLDQYQGTKATMRSTSRLDHLLRQLSKDRSAARFNIAWARLERSAANKDGIFSPEASEELGKSIKDAGKELRRLNQRSEVTTGMIVDWSKTEKVGVNLPGSYRR